jgi:hypothetical protein
MLKARSRTARQLGGAPRRGPFPSSTSTAQYLVNYVLMSEAE